MFHRFSMLKRLTQLLSILPASCFLRNAASKIWLGLPTSWFSYLCASSICDNGMLIKPQWEILGASMQFPQNKSCTQHSGYGQAPQEIKLNECTLECSCHQSSEKTLWSSSNHVYKLGKQEQDFCHSCDVSVIVAPLHPKPHSVLSSRYKYNVRQQMGVLNKKVNRHVARQLWFPSVGDDAVHWWCSRSVW